MGSLLLGFSRAGLGLIYVSIAASMLATGCLVRAVVHRRRGPAADRPGDAPTG